MVDCQDAIFAGIFRYIRVNNVGQRYFFWKINISFEPQGDVSTTRKINSMTQPFQFMFQIIQNHPKCNKISFGGIPKSRNVLFLQIFLKRAAKPSAGNPVEPVGN